MVLLVSISPRRRVLRAKKFTLLGLMVDASAKKFAQRTKNGPKMVLYGVLGEYFRGNAANSRTLGEFCRGRELEGLVWVAGGQSPVFKPPRHPV